MLRRSSPNWRAAIYAGIAAGIIATVIQILLWWAFRDVLPWIVYRDARLTAAMVLGRGVLAPPASFDWMVMCVATAIHFALSIIYSLVLAWFISRCGLLFALLAGVVYGLVLYGINMYGFTLLFPWFAEVRDWITVATHTAFGISAAGIYKVLSGADDRNSKGDGIKPP